ncbi:MAG: hypothetical protein IT379_34215 [Deltaproteobacteria bacterium]|nr:hypothetical protein [Deltaproteobacteria bacterium]
MANPTRPLTPPRLAFFALAVPWFALWLLWRGLRSIRRVVRAGLGVRAALADDVVCAAGHRSSALGRWQCRCGFEYAGRAFSPCPSCGEEAGWIRCDQCGLGVRNPENAP